ncbi:MAG: hypothetical protein H0U25_10015 [Thermoleophilaceae bacterium]|nr:hypothetical protein [Thermoleophilaceae bacterium]
MADRVALEAPLDGTFGPVVRLIVGGIAERVDFGFEAMDDLQLAIERLLAEAGSDGRVSMTFDLAPGRIQARIGPLREAGIAGALRDSDGAPSGLTLSQILETVVDSFGVDNATGGEIIVRLEKLVAAGG